MEKPAPKENSLASIPEEDDESGSSQYLSQQMSDRLQVNRINLNEAGHDLDKSAVSEMRLLKS